MLVAARAVSRRGASAGAAHRPACSNDDAGILAGGASLCIIDHIVILVEKNTAAFVLRSELERIFASRCAVRTSALIPAHVHDRACGWLDTTQQRFALLPTAYQISPGTRLGLTLFGGDRNHFRDADADAPRSTRCHLRWRASFCSGAAHL